MFGQEIGMNTVLFPHTLSILQEKEHSETVTHLCCNEVTHHPVEHNALLRKRQSSYGKYSIDKCAVMSKRNGHFSPLEDATHHSDTHARCTACSCVSGFLFSLYAHWCQLEVLLLLIVAS